MAAMTVEEALAVLCAGTVAGDRLYFDNERTARQALATLRDAAADAKRYRWLRSQVRWELPNQRDSWTTPSGVYLVATMVSKVYGDCDEQTDAAIDAAIGEQP